MPVQPNAQDLLAAVVLVANSAHDQHSDDDSAGDQEHGRRQKLNEGVPGSVVRENHGDVGHCDVTCDCYFWSEDLLD